MQQISKFFTKLSPRKAPAKKRKQADDEPPGAATLRSIAAEDNTSAGAAAGSAEPALQPILERDPIQQSGT
jgi:hypothetical protein